MNLIYVMKKKTNNVTDGDVGVQAGAGRNHLRWSLGDTYQRQDHLTEDLSSKKKPAKQETRMGCPSRGEPKS